MAYAYYGRPPELLSRPVKLYFAGWETDTLRLQQNGWQLNAHEDYAYRGMQIAMQHPEYNIRGISSKIDYRERIYNNNDYPIEASAQLSSDFNTHTYSIAPFTEFKPIDAEPQWSDSREQMSRQMYFAPNLARTQELIVPEHDVDELMAMILKKQAINREELLRRRIREHGLRDDFSNRSTIHAQIISVAA